MKRLIFDIDFIIFAAASIAEERFITATHTPTGRKIEFENKTALYGHYKKKEGGWIASENLKDGNNFWKVEDFEILECQRPRPFKVLGKDVFTGEHDKSKDYFISPLEGAKQIVDSKIADICAKLGTTEYSGYTGKGDVFRHDVCTLLYYKDRGHLMKPLILDKLKQYVCDRHNCELVVGLEADDYCNMAVLKGYDNWVANGRKDEDIVIGLAEDKDSKQCSGWHFNPNKDSEPRLIEGLGSLWLTEKDEVDGHGRMWLYFQIGSSDSSDNYAANCFSDLSWGSKSAYKVLKDSKTDKEALEGLVIIFKKLYPEKKTVEGCKGLVEIDWLYVMQECFTMALMLRHPEDRVDVKALLTKLNIAN